MPGLKVLHNNFFSRGSGGDRKVSPILVRAPLTGLTIRNNYAVGYTSPYFVTTDDAALCGSNGSVWNSTIDDIEMVDPSIRGLFSGRAKPGYLRAIQANPSVSALRVVYGGAISALGALGGSEPVPECALLGLSASRVNYANALGVTTYDTTVAQQQKPIWVAGSGAVVTTTLNLTVVPINTPVYMASGSALSLTATTWSDALIVGRTASAGANGKVRITFENKDELRGHATVTPGVLAAGASGAVVTVSVPGLLEGDMVEGVSFSQSGLAFKDVHVSSAGSVRATPYNATAASVDFVAGTVRVKAKKAS
jgi:hypothetical protein